MDFHELLVILARDGQVDPRDRRNVDCLGGGDVGLQDSVLPSPWDMKGSKTPHLVQSIRFFLVVLDPKM